ncbi:MAG: hypothetical protein ACRD98_06265, partial [Nitrososphaera sp.]
YSLSGHHANGGGGYRLPSIRSTIPDCKCSPPNPSGVHVLHDAPGLGRSARGTGDKDFWAHPPEARHYRCEVTDPERRFHPVAFEARLKGWTAMAVRKPCYSIRARCDTGREGSGRSGRTATLEGLAISKRRRGKR